MEICPMCRGTGKVEEEWREEIQRDRRRRTRYDDTPVGTVPVYSPGSAFGWVADYIEPLVPRKKCPLCGGSGIV